MNALKLAIPSKGRLQAQTIEWFAEKGISIIPAEGGREYSGRVDGIDGVELVLLSAGEIPRELERGRVHVGLTGRDLVEEKLAGWQDKVTEIATPGFGYADLVVAVPNSWVDVTTMDDLDAVAAQFRRTHGFRLRIATKYHNLVRGFMRQQDIADYQLVDSQGATEGTIRNMTAEAIADITTTGQTLTANNLRILDDGLILKSEAVVFASKTAAITDEQKSGLQKLIAALS